LLSAGGNTIRGASRLSAFLKTAAAAIKKIEKNAV
jgi:hypothetical protein